MRWPSMSDINLMFRYYASARTVYDAHSPFFYNFIKEVLDTEKVYYVHEDIENLRQKLSRINKEVEFKELGAGSKIDNSTHRNVKDIARNSATSSKDGKILFNLVIGQQPETILELGTSLGIGTAYLASAAKSAQVFTIEGDPASAYIAQRNFDLLGLKNIHLKEGAFDDVLHDLIPSISPIDLVYVDGDHTYESTIRYFDLLKDKMSHQGVIVLDDIRWSSGMFRAWLKLKNDAKVRASINTYSKGFLFFSPQIKSEIKHFTFIPTRYKPWRIGLFS
jgi:predicted O-methyltransferase YrrM